MNNSNIDMLNNVTNDLILKYDDKFNELYDKKINIDSSIMNKEELLIKENDEIYVKNNTLSILQYTNIAIIVFGVILITYGMGKIDYKKFIQFTIILIVVYILVILFTSYIYLTSENLVKNINGVKVEMAKYVDTVIADELNLTCPSTCIVNPDVSPGSTILSYEQPTLRTDPQLNVWQYGDIPENLYTSPKTPASAFYSNYSDIVNYRQTLEEEMGNEPKPFFNTTYPSSTYYRCKWNGGNTNNGGLPNVENIKFSSIPCSYRPNFTEEARYICTKDPNKLSESDFNKVCNNV
jgi:hypothetical protein